MALNKKLIVLSGVGLVFAGVGAGVIGYKASQVADGQKQMDDSKASMGGQLSFGLASPLAGFAATSATDFMANIGAQAAADFAKNGKIEYVNLSDSIQGDLITGAAHSAAFDATGKPTTAPANTKVGDTQMALDQELRTTLKAAFGTKSITLDDSKIVSTDFEIPNLRASDIRKLINNDLSDKRIFELYSSSPIYKGTALGTVQKITSDLTKAGKSPAEIQSGVAQAIKALNVKTIENGKKQLKSVIEKISSATVVSLNVGIEDIIEAASGGADFTTLLMNEFGMNPTAPANAPKLSTMMGAMASGGSAVMESAINAVGNLNGALSAIRRINPTAKIALGQLSTYGVDAIDNSLALINNALNVAAFTQDIKSGDVSVAPIDPTAKLFEGKTKSLQDIYAADPTHSAVATMFATMVAKLTAGTGGKP